MLYQDDILFYNVDELVRSPEYPGGLLSRFPTALIDQMDVSLPAQFSRGCELRFWQMPDAAPTTINLYTMREKGQVIVMFGEHHVKVFDLPLGEITPIEILMDPIFADHLILDEMATELRYPSTLCRVFFNNEAKISYCGKGELTEAQVAAFGVPIAPKCDTRMPVYMPHPDLFFADGTRNVAKTFGIETPPSQVAPYYPPVPPQGIRAMQASKIMLAYGSSITHGSSATSNYQSYLQLTAQRLGCDALNFGMSGACTCDKAMTDYIAAVPDIDFYFLELGINMRHRYYVEEFEERLIYLLKALQGRKVYVTTIYPNRGTYLEIESLNSAQERAFNDLIRKYAPMYGAVLLEGSDIFTNPEYLAFDYIHPSPLGHMKMAENLSKLLWNERNV